MTHRFVFAFLLLLLLGACMPHTMPNHSSVVYVPPTQQQLQPQQLRVQAEAQVEAIPDLLRLRLGVITEAADAGKALSENNQRMRKIMAMLLQLGLEMDDLATGQFQISPQWSQPPRPTPANWQREIVGYRVSNDLWITTTRVELAGDLLGLGHRSGANQVGNLQFSIADSDAYQQRAMTLATEKAVRQAQILAAAAGAQLGDILSLSLDTPGGIYNGVPMMAEARMLSTADSVPVTPGQVDIRAGVTIVYQLISTVEQ